MCEEHGSSRLIELIVVSVGTVAEREARIEEISPSDSFDDRLGGG